jgi:hypothetical protein
LEANSSQGFSVCYRGKRFPTGLISDRGLLRFTCADLVHALFTTGRAPGDQVSHGAASVWELLHRAALVRAYIQRTPHGRLARSQLALELDRSEKVALSYAFGQALTGIFCDRILAVEFLMHVDRYSGRYRVNFTTRRRADLFGLRRPEGWVVAEAKGRSNLMESDLEQKLSAQKRSIASISGEPPWLALGCVASFPPNFEGMRVDVFDPKEPDAEAIAFDVDLDRYMLAYYEPFLEAIEFGESEPGRVDYEFARFDILGIRIGLSRSIADRVQRARVGEVAGLYDFVIGALDRVSAVAAVPFRDGTIVETDWEDSITLNDWEA